MKEKQGISLLVLTIIIIVMIILAGTVVYTSAEATNNSKMAAFISDLETIGEAVEKYYLNNEELPIVLDTEYTKTSMINQLIEEDRKKVLSKEIDELNDTEKKFYEIDMSKLEIKFSQYGMKEDGDPLDAYYISEGNHNIYYLKGRRIARKYYFTLTEKLTGKKIVNSLEPEDTSSVNIVSKTDGIKISKNTKEWTNDLKVNVKTTFESGEKMSFFLGGIATLVNVTQADYTFIIKDYLKETNNSVWQAVVINKNKTLTVKKLNSLNQIIAETTINIDNVDMIGALKYDVAPSMTVSKNESFNLIKLSNLIDNNESGVKNLRYLKTKKRVIINGTETQVDYYDNQPITITWDYIYNAGTISDARMIKLPKDVSEIKVVFEDNAGNVDTQVVTYVIN
ncbi:MAG: hypothetical protein PHR25_03590 [Clostridia bacterium]|nr:hypothetical protein [Clostridia bacterium]MDD4375844.1 hypothetical protein [Clostridia bacterium]